MEIGLKGCKGIVLDIDGTICSLSKSVGEVYSEVLNAQGIRSDGGLLDHATRKVWQEFESEYLNSQQDYRTDNERERSVWFSYAQRVLQVAGVSQWDDETVVRAIYDSFATGSNRQLEVGVVHFLERASSREIKVFAATNNDQRSKQVLSDLGVSLLLEGIFTAGDLGWKKPSAKFFQGLSARVELSPGELIHIGNNRALDVEPAERSGWKAILYTKKMVSGAQRVKSFDELSTLLGL